MFFSSFHPLPPWLPQQPAPFIQIRLLKILALLCRADRPASEAAYAVLGECLRRAQASGNTIGYAIICEAVRTIAACHPHPGLLNAATDSLALFLRPGAPHNLKYAGIGLLGDLIAASPEAAAQHQMAVIGARGEGTPCHAMVVYLYVPLIVSLRFYPPVYMFPGNERT